MASNGRIPRTPPQQNQGRRELNAPIVMEIPRMDVQMNIVRPGRRIRENDCLCNFLEKLFYCIMGIAVLSPSFTPVDLVFCYIISQIIYGNAIRGDLFMVLLRFTTNYVFVKILLKMVLELYGYNGYL